MLWILLLYDMNDVQKTKNSRALNKGPEKLKLKTKQKKLLAKK